MKRTGSMEDVFLLDPYTLVQFFFSVKISRERKKQKPHQSVNALQVHQADLQVGMMLQDRGQETSKTLFSEISVARRVRNVQVNQHIRL